MDDYTLALLTNSEVLAVDQDPLGRRRRTRQTERPPRGLGTTFWPTARWPWACSTAENVAGTVRIDWPDLNLHGPQPVRDLWRQQDLAAAASGWEAAVPRAGAVLLRIGKPRP